MDLQDKMSKQPIKGLKLPNLKGHVKITVTDKNGKIKQQVEGDNVVTNAVRDIIANDYLGALDPNTITPLWEKWYGGILLYGPQHSDLDPDHYYIKNFNSQPLMAHAGHDNPDDLSDDPRRGFYNTAGFSKTKNSVTQRWEWHPEAGAFSVGSLSLCHETIGNAGTGCCSGQDTSRSTNAFKALQPFEILSTRIPSFTANMVSPENILFMIDNCHGGWFEMGDYGEYANMHSRFETHYLTVYIKRLAFREAGLYECDNVADDWTTHFTIDLVDNIYVQPAYAYVGGYLWIFNNITGSEGSYDGNNLTWDPANIHWWKIDIANQTVTDSGVWNNPRASSTSLGPTSVEARGWYDALAPVSVGTRSIFPQIPYVYDYTNSYEFYFPICENPSSHGTAPCFDVKAVLAYSLQYNTWTIQTNYLDKQYEFMNSMSSDNQPSLVVMPGRIGNGSFFYTCQTDPFWVDDRNVYITAQNTWAFATPYKPSSYLIPIGGGFNFTGARYLVANKFLNTTKFNLPTSIVKDADDTLTVEYTLTQI